jgi:hypothetical protein
MFHLSLSPFNGWQSANGTSLWQFVYKDALSYLCVYSRGWKDEDSISAAWDYVKREKCGFNSLGYAQVEGGESDWFAGYTFDGD